MTTFVTFPDISGYFRFNASVCVETGPCCHVEGFDVSDSFVSFVLPYYFFSFFFPLATTGVLTPVIPTLLTWVKTGTPSPDHPGRDQGHNSTDQEAHHGIVRNPTASTETVVCQSRHLPFRTGDQFKRIRSTSTAHGSLPLSRWKQDPHRYKGQTDQADSGLERIIKETSKPPSVSRRLCPVSRWSGGAIDIVAYERTPFGKV